MIYPAKSSFVLFFHLKLICKLCTPGKIENLLEFAEIFSPLRQTSDLDTVLMPVSDQNVYDKMYYFFIRA